MIKKLVETFSFKVYEFSRKDIYSNIVIEEKITKNIAAVCCIVVRKGKSTVLNFTTTPDFCCCWLNSFQELLQKSIEKLEAEL